MSKSCKYSTYCGGCVGLDKDYSCGLEEKSKYIKKLFSCVNPKKIEPCEGPYFPYKYRNKVHLAFTELKGKTLIGFFEEGSTKVQDVDSCLLFGDWLVRLIKILREYVSKFNIRAYDKKSGFGILRYAHARCIDEKIQLTLVVTTDNFAGRSWLFKTLSDNFKDVSLYLNINRRTDQKVLDKNLKHIAGNKYLQFNLCGVKVKLTPDSFLQVNLPMCEKMYRKAIELLDLDKNTNVLDLYSGIGITSILFAKECNTVYSIEEVSGAVSNAKNIAKENGVNNVRFFVGKCEEKIKSIDFAKMDNLKVFVDPARMGIDVKVIDTILDQKPERIVYMSCNPETCLTDIKRFISDNKYYISDIYSYDMFPYTKHIETLVCLQRQV